MNLNGAATDSPLSHNIDFLVLQAVIIFDNYVWVYQLS